MENIYENKKKYRPLRLPSYREIAEQLVVFPEAKEYLEMQTRKAKKTLKKLEIAKYIIERKSNEKEFWNGIIEVLYQIPAEFIIKRNNLAINKKEYGNVLNIERAKAYPITNLIEFKGRTAKCFNHTERTSSLYYYPDNNTCHCFGACGKSFDSIDVYQILNNCSFIEAVKALQ